MLPVIVKVSARAGATTTPLRLPPAQSISADPAAPLIGVAIVHALFVLAEVEVTSAAAMRNGLLSGAVTVSGPDLMMVGVRSFSHGVK